MLSPHHTAAILHGLPVYGEIPEATHLSTPSGRTPSSTPTPQVIRHRAQVKEQEIVTIAGLRCTSLNRTLVDLARFAPQETALCAVDGYLREEFRVNRHVDWERHAEWLAEMQAQLGGLQGARGVARASQVFEIADPRTDSVLESLSHLQLRRLGFEVALQVAVRSPSGGTYHVDFEFVGRDLFGECDGKHKYLDARLRGGLSAEEVVYREKRRRDWIRGVTKKDLIHWGYADVRAVQTFAHRLEAFGLVLPRPPT